MTSKVTPAIAPGAFGGASTGSTQPARAVTRMSLGWSRCRSGLPAPNEVDFPQPIEVQPPVVLDIPAPPPSSPCLQPGSILPIPMSTALICPSSPIIERPGPLKTPPRKRPAGVVCYIERTNMQSKPGPCGSVESISRQGRGSRLCPKFWFLIP